MGISTLGFRLHPVFSSAQDGIATLCGASGRGSGVFIFSVHYTRGGFWCSKGILPRNPLSTSTNASGSLPQKAQPGPWFLRAFGSRDFKYIRPLHFLLHTSKDPGYTRKTLLPYGTFHSGVSLDTRPRLRTAVDVFKLLASWSNIGVINVLAIFLLSCLWPDFELVWHWGD